MRTGAQRDANEEELMAEALSMGWVPIRVSDKGFPDLVCVRKGETRYVEVKSKEKRTRITPAQLEVFATLRANGVAVHVCVTREDIRAALGPAPAPQLTPAQVTDARSVLPASRAWPSATWKISPEQEQMLRAVRPRRAPRQAPRR